MSDEIQPAPAAPVIAFADPLKRLASIDLDYPLVVDGKPLDRIVIKRLTLQEVSDYMRLLAERQKTDPDAPVFFPVYFDAAGQQLPDAVIGALDDDDAARVEKVVAGFLPRRFQASPQA